MNWQKIMIGDTKFSRMYDDQLAVTIPAAMLAPNRSWEMEYNGVDLQVYHNGWLDGKRWSGAGGFIKWWQSNATSIFPEALGRCEITDKNR